MFTVLDDITYGKFISTGSIILEGIDESMPYVHHHPHLFQSPLGHMQLDFERTGAMAYV